MNPPTHTNDEPVSPLAPSLWSNEDLCRYLKISVKTAYNLRKRGLPHLQIGHALRYQPDEILSFLATNRGLSLHRQRQARKEAA